MKKIFLISCILALSILGATEQAIFSTIVENEKISNTLDSYFFTKLGNYTILNNSFLRYSSEKFSDEIYLSNYLRNRLFVQRTFGNFTINGFAYGGAYLSDNNPNHIAGLNNQYLLDNSFSLGFETKYHTQKMSLFFSTKNNTNLFTEENSNSKISDASQISNFFFSLNNLKFQPFINIDYYDDLNSSNIYNYHKAAIGIAQNKKLSHSKFFRFSGEIGSSGLYDNLPYYGKFSARLTNKIGRNWFILSRVKLENYLNNDFSEIYRGESFTENMIQYNYGYQNNQKNFLQLGFLANLDKFAYLKIASKYNFRIFGFYTDYQHYFGNKNSDKGRFSAKLEINLSQFGSLIIGDEIEISNSDRTNKFVLSTKIRI